VIGPLADAAAEMAGPWAAAGEPETYVSVLAGLHHGLPGTELVHAPGVAIDSGDCSGIAAAVELCSGVDAIVLCLGEAARMSGEAASRADPGLPGQQRALAEAVMDRARADKVPVVAILFTGRPLTVPWLAERADALLAAWFLGSEAGNALAEILTGRTSPSGRTPISWPRAVGQVPIFFGQRPTGRPVNPADPFTSGYLDVCNDPLYPFGHGLTYARCTFANLRVSPTELTGSDTLQAQIDVRNDGKHAGEETLFLFIHDKVASVARPLLELRAFGRIRLRPGETATLTLRVPAAELRFLGTDLTPVLESGEVEIFAGPSADRSRLLGALVRLRS